MQFILGIEEHTYLKIAIMMAVHYITTDTSDSPEYACLKAELQVSSLKRALEHIHGGIPSELDEDDVYHVQRAIAFRLLTLTKTFYNEGSAPHQMYNFYRCETNYLLNVYGKLM